MPIAGQRSIISRYTMRSAAKVTVHEGCKVTAVDFLAQGGANVTGRHDSGSDQR
jgi:hypothetical protein